MDIKDKKHGYFIRIPNHFIKCDIEKEYGIGKKFYIIYALISRYRSYEGYSWITLKKILESCGCKKIMKGTSPFKEVLDVLDFMVSRNMIRTKQDIRSISLTDGIEIKIVPENFDAFSNGFTKLYSYQLDFILHSDCPYASRENILSLLLYMLCYITNNNNLLPAENSNEKNTIPVKAFYRSIECIASDISISKPTISKCLEYLTETHGNKNAIFIKREPIQYKILSTLKKNIRKTPAIYVLNQPGYKKEIGLAINRLKQLYHIPDASIIEN